MLRRGVYTAALLSALVSAPAVLFAQGELDVSGFTLTERIQGTGSSLGLITKFDTAFGYRFNQYLAVEGGLPVYVENLPTSVTGANGRTLSGIGNAYGDVRFSLENPLVNFDSILTVAAPTGSKAAGFSTGSVTYDWSNIFSRTFSRVTPFATVGIANTLMDQPFFIRPFSSLGFLSHFEGGASYRLIHKISVGASVYGIEPAGQQRVYSQLVTVPNPGRGPFRRHHGVFEVANVTVGDAAILQDYGFESWVGSRLSRYAYVEVGYSRSVEYALNNVFFDLTFTLGSLLPGHH
jgi:hypothetical protein